jgi:uncharacterized protein YecA (UPF0149 family)
VIAPKEKTAAEMTTVHVRTISLFLELKKLIIKRKKKADECPCGKERKRKGKR